MGNLGLCFGALAVALASCSTEALAGDEKFLVKVVEASGSIDVSKLGVTTSAYAKVILPNGDHADLLCYGRDGHCAKIGSAAPEKTRPEDTTCGTVGNETMCISKNVGEFAASRKGNVLTVEAPNGRLRFRIVGSW